MGMNIGAYIERKSEDGNWELVTEKPICTRLKYIFKEFSEFPEVKRDGLSDGLKNQFKVDENGECYATFYALSTTELDKMVGDTITRQFIKVNTIMKAMDAKVVHNDDGEEYEWMDDSSKEQLTIPVNKDLMVDVQYAIDEIRNAGQCEMFDLIVDEYVEYGKEYRVVFVYC